jgi:hypothetical protein
LRVVPAGKCAKLIPVFASSIPVMDAL